MALGPDSPPACFVINLARSTQRRARMQERLAAIGLAGQFVTATDGTRLSAAELARYDAHRARRVYGSEMSAGEIACCLSHLAVLARIRDQALPAALVLEDDVIFAPGFAALLHDLCALPDRPWQVVRLNVLKGPVLAPRTRRDHGREIARLGGFGLYRVGRNPLGAGAYLVTAEGAAAILRHADPIFAPFDHMLDRFWENGILPYVVRPCPVWQDQSLGSEIGLRGTRRYTTTLLGAARRHWQRVTDSVNKRLFLHRQA